MLPKYIAQIIVAGAQVFARAFTRALREELRQGQRMSAKEGTAEQQGGQTGKQTRQSRQTAALNSRHGLSLQEACQILNVKPELADEQQLRSNYRHLFDSNDKLKGGSLYLQSKVVRAKERIDEELSCRSSSTA